MRDKRALDLGGAHAVAGDVDDVVDAPRDPPIAVSVAAAAVAGEISALEGGEIGFGEALVIAIDGAHHPGPGIEDDEISLRLTFEDLAVGIDHRRLHAEEGQRRGSRLQIRRAGQR